MNIGIYYMLKRNARAENQSSENNEIIFSGASDYYCTNPFTALKIAHTLSKGNKDYRFGIQEIPQDIANNKIHIANFGEFVDYCETKNAKDENSSTLDMLN